MQLAFHRVHAVQEHADRIADAELAPGSLADYLAKNYLTADPKPEKKSKKRKRKDASNGLTIADDDDMSWDASRNVGDDDDGPITGSSPLSPPRPRPLTIQ